MENRNFSCFVLVAVYGSLLSVALLRAVVTVLPLCSHYCRNPTTGGWRAVKIAGEVLHPPEGGWSDIVYVVVTPPVKVTGS